MDDAPLRQVLDHVAILAADRDALAAELTERFDMHVIDRTDRFTLVGVDADLGKLTLLDAPDGVVPMPHRIGALVLASDAGASDMAPVRLSNGLDVTFASTKALGGDDPLPRHAVVGLVLRVVEPSETAVQLVRDHGMRVDVAGPDTTVVDVGDRSRDGRVTFVREPWSEEGVAMLDHLGLRVDDVDAWVARAGAHGVEVVERVEAAHSRAAFVMGPEGLKLEFVELTEPLEP